MRHLFTVRAGWLLLGAILCAFLCWGIVWVVADVDEMKASTVATEASIKTLADNAAQLARDADGGVLDARAQLQWTMANMQDASASLKHASAGVDLAVEEINRPCPTGGDESAPCGTIATANRALNSLRLAAGQVTAVSLKEQDKLNEANQHETEIANATRDTIVKLGAAIDKVGELADNQDLRGSLGNLNKTSGALAGMAGDTQSYWHNFLFPKWPARIGRALKTLAIGAGKVLF